jgi:hypothetical protein
MNPILATSYALNKSASKFVYVSSDAEKKVAILSLCKGIENVVIRLTDQELRNLQAESEVISSHLTKGCINEEGIKIGEGLHVKIQDIFNSKAVVIEKTVNQESTASLYYHPPTWNALKSLFPLLNHQMAINDLWALPILDLENTIVEDVVGRFSSQNFKQMHVFEFQDLLTRLNPSLYDIVGDDNPLNNFDKIRCFYELVLYYPYNILQKVIERISG